MTRQLLIMCLITGAVTLGAAQNRTTPRHQTSVAKEAPRPARPEPARGANRAASSTPPTRRAPQDMAKLRESARQGVRQHQKIQTKYDVAHKGRIMENRVTHSQTRQRNQIDVYGKSGRPFEIKPDTASGRKKGRPQLRRYEAVTGRRGGLILYEPQTGKYRIERTPYPEWQKRQAEAGRTREPARERVREVRRPRVGF